MASFVTNAGAAGLLDGTIVWSSATIKARLVDSGATLNKDDTDLTAYTQIGGSDKTLGSKTQTKDTTNDRIVFNAADPATWSAVAGGSTIGWVVVFKFVTDDAGSTPIFVIDVPNVATNGSDITAPFAATGIGYVQQ